METYIEKYILYLKEKKKYSVNTIESYSRDLRFFNNFAKDLNIINIKNINKTNLMAYVLLLQKKGMKEATIARNIVVLRNFFKFAFYERIIEVDPAMELESPKITSNTNKKLSKDEIDNMLSQVDENNIKGIRDKCILLLLCHSDIKVSSLLALKKEDINLNSHFIKYETPKGDIILKTRPEISDAIKKYLQSLPSDQNLLFEGRNNKPMTRQSCWKIIKKYGEKTGVGEFIAPEVL